MKTFEWETCGGDAFSRKVGVDSSGRGGPAGGSKSTIPAHVQASPPAQDHNYLPDNKNAKTSRKECDDINITSKHRK